MTVFIPYLFQLTTKILRAGVSTNEAYLMSDKTCILLGLFPKAYLPLFIIKDLLLNLPSLFKWS